MGCLRVSFSSHRYPGNGTICERGCQLCSLALCHPRIEIDIALFRVGTRSGVGQRGGLVLVLHASSPTPRRTSTRPPHPLSPAPCPYERPNHQPRRGQAQGPHIHSAPPLV